MCMSFVKNNRDLCSDLGRALREVALARHSVVHAICLCRDPRGRATQYSISCEVWNKPNIVRNITSGKCDKAVDAARQLQRGQGISVNPETIRNVLKLLEVPNHPR